jgi:cell division protein FtsW
MVFSSSSIMAVREHGDSLFFLKRQGMYALAGLSLMAVLMHFNYQYLRKLAVPILLLCIVMLVLVLIPGIGAKVGGASRWIRVAGFSLQPAEFAKLGLIIFMAHSLARKQDKMKSFKLGFIPYMGLLAILLGLMLAQPDLGSALTLALVAMVMMFIAGTRLVYIAGLGILALPFLYFMVMNVDYRRRRILAFLNPWEDPSNTGFQIIQSWIAFGSGGPVGNGLGESKQKLFFLPEAHTDFIFAVIGEELGFIGVLVIATMFLFLVLRGFRAATHAPDNFGSYLAFGMSLLLGIEAFVNMAVVMGLVPTKGMALPFLSYGGSSLMASLMAVGIILSVSSKTPGEVR